MTSLPTGNGRKTTSFGKDRRGSVMMMFAMLAMLLFGAGGMAIDYARAISIQSHAQTALDAAVLAATDALVPTSDKKKRFETVFEANFKTPNANVKGLKYAYAPGKGGKGEATVRITTNMLRLFGLNDLAMPVVSAANQDQFDIEVAMALDVSGSMQFGLGGVSRLQALKDAANRLIDMLEDTKGPNQSIKYAIVPFTMNVNIGKANAGYVEQTNHALFTGTEWKGCVLERPGSYASSDDYVSGSPARNGGKWHAYIWPPEPNSDAMCINPGNGDNTGYQSVVDTDPLNPTSSWTAGPNYNCVRHEVVPLTSDVGTVRSKINELTAPANMGTMIAPAVAWAHRVLSPAEPFNEGQDFGPTVRKVMVVITDGAQTTEGPYNSGCQSTTNTGTAYTFDPASFGLDGSAIGPTGPRDMFSPYGYLYDSNTLGTVTTWTNVDDQMETAALDACAKFKARGATDKIAALYTIAASSGAAPGTRVYNTLQKCASTPDHFFFAGDSESLESAFEMIARNTAGLRLTQ